MSLLVYECQRADYGHEIRQFGEVARCLREYYNDRQELALLIGNINIGNVNLDGLIIKNDAIIILELKDRSGEIVARINGDWTCDGEIVKGGSNKTVFEQLKVNRRELKASLSSIFNKAQIADIQGLVVFAELKKFANEMDRDNKQWVHVADVQTVGGAMHDIKARAFHDYKTDKKVDAVFSRDSICQFIRGMKIPESALVTDLSDTNRLPSDLFHKDAPHNGKTISTETQLANKSAEVDLLKGQLEELKQKLEDAELGHKVEILDKQSIINQQKAEILAAKEQHIIDEKTAMEEMLKSETAEQEIKRIKEKLDEAKREIEALAEEKKNLERKMSEKVGPSPLASNEDVQGLKAEIERLRAELTKTVSVGSAEVQQGAPLPKSVRNDTQKDWDVPEDSMDDDQLDLIEHTLDKSMLVTGCAGCGKSVIAMNKAVQIKNAGGDVILIALTKSLNRFMGYGKQRHELGSRFYYHWQWERDGKPSADYVIVDEIQDFTEGQIKDFIRAAKKSYFFFGDTAQSIYRAFGVNTLTIDQISSLTGLKPLRLYNNYRLPRGIAKITQPYVAVGANEYNEKIYQSKEPSVPHIIHCADFSAQVRLIVEVIRELELGDVGILMPSNDGVLRMAEALNGLDIPCEFKYSPKGNQKEWRDTLNFKSGFPKIMTYHSAKGLQFESVFLPEYEGASNEDKRKALYVAMTRTWRDLYVLYSGALKAPLDKVPRMLYLSKV